MTSQNLRHASLFCLALVLFFFRETLLSGSGYFAGDLTYYWWPRKNFIAECLQSGTFPLWDPTFRCGIPFFAIPDNGTLDAASLFFNFLPFAAALKAFHLFSYFMLALGSFLLVKILKGSNAAAAFAAILFPFGGYCIARSQFLSQCATLTWGVWLFALLLARKPLWAALPAALLVFAGHWQTAIIFSISGAATLAVFSQSGAERRDARDYFRDRKGALAAALALILGLGAAQILPALELTALSQWGREGVAAAQSAAFSLPWRSLAKIFYRGAEAAGAQRLDNAFWVEAVQIGALPCALALWGFWALPKRRKIGFAILIAASILLSVGILQGRVPFLNYIRYPSRWFFGAYAALIVLACAGFSRLPRGFKAPALLLTVAQLTWSWTHFLPLASPDYFRQKGELVEYLQQNLHPQKRFFFSFKAERLLMGQGENWKEQAEDLRDRLYVRTPLVYHLPQGGGFGEPLVPQNFDRFLEKIQASPTPDDAQNRLSRLGALKIFSAEPWNTKVYPEGPVRKWFLYDNPEALPRAYWIHPEIFSQTQNGEKRELIAPLGYLASNESIRIEGSASQNDGWVILSDTNYPGWKAYLNGARVQIEADNDAFRAVQVPQHFALYFVYQPASFQIGALLTIAAILFLFFKGVQQCKSAPTSI